MNKMTDELWSLVSEYVRRSEADEYGMCKCATCGKRMRWQDLQGGHGLGRYHMATKYDLRNILPQCEPCNGPGRGMVEKFKVVVDQKHGAGTWDELERLSRTVSKLSLRDRAEMTEHFKNLLKSLKTKAA